MTDVGLRDLETFAEALRPKVAQAANHIVLVHPPKAAGSAFGATARAAGWTLLSLDDFRSRQGRCSQCRPRRCSRASRWERGMQVESSPGVLVTVGHRPLAIGEKVADLLASANDNARVVMVGRPALARLHSLFRFVWRNALRGGLEGVVGRHAVIQKGHRSAASPIVRGHLAVRLLRRQQHGERREARAARDAVNYLEWDRNQLRIRGDRWIQAFLEHSTDSVWTYWMHQFSDIVPLQQKMLAGNVEVVTIKSLDSYCRQHFGIPSLRTNVSSDVLNPMVERALEESRTLFELAARQDAEFDALVS